MPMNELSSSPYVISHPVTDSNPSQTAVQVGAARNMYQHSIVNISRGKMGGGGNNKDKNKKNKKSKKYSRKSAMKSRFSRKFRRSILRKKSRRMSLFKKNRRASFYGGSEAKLTIPSFRQESGPGGSIINQLAGNHAQTLAYSAYDNQVTKPTSS
jgi:hypothetical protein